MREFPMFLGIDHYNGDLAGKMAGVIEKFCSNGSRLFIELSPGGVSRCLRRKSHVEPPFEALVKAAHKKGVETIPLDKNSFRSLTAALFSPGMTPAETKYVVFNLRERHWERLLKTARKADVVVMHPEHLKRIQKSLCFPESRVKYFPTAKVRAMKPLSKAEFNLFLAKRLKQKAAKTRAALAKKEKALRRVKRKRLKK